MIITAQNPFRTKKERNRCYEYIIFALELTHTLNEYWLFKDEFDEEIQAIKLYDELYPHNAGSAYELLKDKLQQQFELIMRKEEIC